MSNIMFQFLTCHIYLCVYTYIHISIWNDYKYFWKYHIANVGQKRDIYGGRGKGGCSLQSLWLTSESQLKLLVQCNYFPEIKSAKNALYLTKQPQLSYNQISIAKCPTLSYHSPIKRIRKEMTRLKRRGQQTKWPLFSLHFNLHFKKSQVGK